MVSFSQSVQVAVSRVKKDARVSGSCGGEREEMIARVVSRACVGPCTVLRSLVYPASTKYRELSTHFYGSRLELPNVRFLRRRGLWCCYFVAKKATTQSRRSFSDRPNRTNIWQHRLSLIQGKFLPSFSIDSLNLSFTAIGREYW